ncbi:MAG: hypothetical protein LQ339_000134 [Xanthoria mediterranea]|nr:MAG: hypothetical protein LQ339_000134 [Xanthoria mediterranea]
MHSYIQLLSTPTADTAGTAMILDVGKQRYLFGNIHEGLQRTCIQRNSKLSKTNEVFITGTTEWKNVGGLFGLILTLADANAASIMSEAETARLRKDPGNPEQLAAKSEKQAKVEADRKQALLEAGLDPDEQVGATEKYGKHQLTLPTLTIHGGENLTHTVATGRRFIFRRGMPVKIIEHSDAPPSELAGDGREPDWKDDSIQVWKLPIQPSLESRAPEVGLEGLRKRSFDDFVGADLPSPRNHAASVDHSYTAEDLKEKDQEMRRFVVTEMFNSQWRLDALFEISLPDVHMPAMLWIRSKETNKLERYYPPEDGSLPDIKVLARRPWPGALVEKLPATKPSELAMSYIVRHHPQKGKFNPQKAKALNVHRYVWSALQNGTTVKSRDGLTVTPDMVLEPTRIGGGFAIVDLPTTDYLPNLIARPEWNTSQIMDGLQAIVWNLGPGVARDRTLQAFIQQHSGLKHVISAPDLSTNYITFDSTAALVIRLNQIDSERYQIPMHSNVSPIVQPPHNPEKTKKIGYVEATRDFRLQLEPQLQIQEAPTKQPFLDTRQVLELTPKEVLELAKEARDDAASDRLMEKLAGQNLPSQDAEVICLGTGSSAPSKYRNVSATLLRVPGCGSYLFDCGEGTLGQLRRLYNPTELEGVLRDLKAIWISHMHADHHLGTTSVIKAWREANYGLSDIRVESGSPRETPMSFVEAIQEKKLFLFAGGQMIRWLAEYSSVEAYGYDKVIPINTQPSKALTFSYMEWRGAQLGFSTHDPTMNKAMTEATGMKNLVSCYVDHCQGAQAVTVRFHTGFGFSYSGDCRPSENFIRIGRGSTVLVHEATFDDVMQDDAKAKKHSTMSEAIGVASAMGAKRLILTHFSQRYQKLPNLSALDNTEIVFDDPEPLMDNTKDTDATQSFDETSPSTGGYDHVAGQDVSTSPPAKGRTSPSPFPESSALLSPTKHELKIAIAFDFLRVRVGDIASMERFTPSLQLLFEKLEQREKEEAYHKPGEVARRKKEEQKQEKREAQEKLIKEKKEAKALKRAGLREFRWNTADSRGNGGTGAPASIQGVSEVTHRDRTEEVAEGTGIQLPQPAMEHTAK